MVMGHRWRLAAVIAAASLLSLAASAQADQTITVVNWAHVRPAVLRRVEHAIGRQSWELAYWWHTQPIRFGPGGWKVYLTRHVILDPVYGTRDASPDYHSIALHLAKPEPYMVVRARGQWSIALSHEVLEALVDPTTTRYLDGNWLEVCDPAAPTSYRINGVSVSDFALPADFRSPLNWRAQLDEANDF